MTRVIRFLFWPVIAGLVAAAAIILFMRGQAPAEAPAAPAAVIAPPATEEPPATTPAALPAASGPVSYADAVNRAAPAVVNIYTSKTVETPLNPLFADPRFRRFFGVDQVPMQRRMESSLGSGVIVSAKGYVMTNHHVVADADEIIIALRDGREARAIVVGSDTDTDLAVLRMQLDDIPVIALRDSGSLQIGDVVLAIGNPFGVGQTVTMGIVSATGRSELGVNTFEDFIQTDAAINPGNSGGALVDARGQLVGINSVIFSRSGGYQGIGFAIPTRIVREVLDDILEHGHVVRGWLGLEPQFLTPQLAQALELPGTQGVVVTGLVRNGPAHKAGVLPGDVVTALDGKAILAPRELIDAIAAHEPGTTVKLSLARKGNKVQTVSAVVGERPANGSPTRD
ncbi:MAG: trypsin-like peptidase domain-containing protein [Gammaproteobacteria bacterium]